MTYGLLIVFVVGSVLTRWWGNAMHLMRLSESEQHRIARDVTYGLLVIFVVGSVLTGWSVPRDVAATILWQNFVSILVVAAPLALRHHARKYAFIVILTLLATAQVATDTFAEQQGLWLFLIAVRAADRLEILPNHRRLGLALLVALLVGALTVSGFGYLHVPVTESVVSPTLRLARVIAMVALWGTTAWLLYVVEWRPEIEFRRRVGSERKAIEKQLHVSGILDANHYLRDDYSIGDISLAKRIVALLGQDDPKDQA